MNKIKNTLPDGLHIALCGSGSPFPDPTRAGPCIAVVAGDTKKTPSVVAMSKDVDLLEQEFNQKNMPNIGHVMRDILNYHTTPEEAAKQASAAGAKQLILNHIVPPMPFRYAYPAFLGDAAKHYANPITVGEDGMLFSLPAGGTFINQQKLF